MLIALVVVEMVRLMSEDQSGSLDRISTASTETATELPVSDVLTTALMNLRCGV
ncbi:hypothetical protein RCCS2_17661 [Roseobacter sp. CCS2]|nr:hypothetical protein RCCS2_17661 [Roseobacter sp. CCS2]